ncbi:uncharacterized protein LOC106462697 [Limulus polyphemus]|uniref:Uncharacterized protein LOC106462697 n=1 Tax=Limulus polyphemus TaxID=6850 RepID=A0ABM1BAG6_LIMPO|nr:uncharacterized protein LOC106462697 [Limulus polyphemus]
MFALVLALLLTSRGCDAFSKQNSIKQYDVQNIDQAKLDALLKFAVREIEKLKLDHHELDECHGLEVASLLRGRKKEKDGIRYSLTLKVQSTSANTEQCMKKSSSFILQPEICEVEVSESVKKGKIERSLLRSACLQVEELME